MCDSLWVIPKKLPTLFWPNEKMQDQVKETAQRFVCVHKMESMCVCIHKSMCTCVPFRLTHAGRSSDALLSGILRRTTCASSNLAQHRNHSERLPSGRKWDFWRVPAPDVTQKHISVAPESFKRQQKEDRDSGTLLSLLIHSLPFWPRL